MKLIKKTKNSALRVLGKLFAKVPSKLKSFTTAIAVSTSLGLAGPAIASDITTQLAWMVSLETTESNANEGIFVVPAIGSVGFSDGVLEFSNTDNVVMLSSATTISFRVTKTNDEANATPINYYYSLKSLDAQKNAINDADLTSEFEVVMDSNVIEIGDAPRLSFKQPKMDITLKSFNGQSVNALVEDDEVNVNATIIIEPLLAI